MDFTRAVTWALACLSRQLIKICQKDQHDKQANAEPHLPSTECINGYYVPATDGEVGHVNDFIMNDKAWQIEFIVVDTHNWFGGKKVMAPVGQILKLEWADSMVFLNMGVAEVEKCKLFTEADSVHLQIKNL